MSDQEQLKQVAAAAGGDLEGEAQAPTAFAETPEERRRREELEHPQPEPRVVRQSSRLDAMSVAKRLKNWITDDSTSSTASVCECTFHGWLGKKVRKKSFFFSFFLSIFFFFST